MTGAASAKNGVLSLHKAGSSVFSALGRFLQPGIQSSASQRISAGEAPSRITRIGMVHKTHQNMRIMNFFAITAKTQNPGEVIISLIHIKEHKYFYILKKYV